MSTASPWHTVMSAGSSTLEPETVIVKVTGSPLQLVLLGVMVIVAVSVCGAFMVVKTMFPVPDAANPMAGLSFVQVYAVVLKPVKATDTGLPPQTVMSLGGFTVGPG